MNRRAFLHIIGASLAALTLPSLPLSADKGYCAMSNWVSLEEKPETTSCWWLVCWGDGKETGCKLISADGEVVNEWKEEL